MRNIHVLPPDADGPGPKSRGRSLRPEWKAAYRNPGRWVRIEYDSLEEARSAVPSLRSRASIMNKTKVTHAVRERLTEDPPVAFVLFDPDGVEDD